jgi:hypothetical protein
MTGRTYKRSWPYDPDRLPPNPTAEQIQAITDDNDIWHLRLERNYKLSQTDWMATGDRETTQAERDYRQALRDITIEYTSLEDVVWPSEPE